MLALNLLWFVLALMFLILVHEAGHMYAARWVGMRVEKFSIFFGRPLVKWNRGETEYALGWIPLGGYVKITGFNSTEEQPEELRDRTYDGKAPWKRIVVILAGPAVNIVLAFLLFAVTFWIGTSQSQLSPVIDQVTPGSPAATAGLDPGDRLLSIDETVTSDVAVFGEAIRGRGVGETITVRYRTADGEEVARQVTLRPLRNQDGSLVERNGEPVPGIGVRWTIEQLPNRSYGLVGGLTEAADLSWEVVVVTAELIPKAFTESEAREQLSGPVGIGAAANEIGDEGIIVVLRFIALLSLALGIFNLLPLLPLDGGHIAVAILNKLTGGRVPPGLVERLSIAGFVFLMLVAVVVLQNDIVRISDGEIIPTPDP
ncbi:MAG: M50 family metallopeptidase [Miltoncostaeaceae bacterium]